jgi:YaaC-like Protein
MPKIEKGEFAKYKYNNVKYSHVDIKPGQASVLTADPWSFLHGTILQKIPKSRGANRKNLERAHYFAHLAEDFFRAANCIDLPSKGTLIYYGMLNLVKCLLSTSGVQLETMHEYHGVNLPLDTKFKLQLQAVAKGTVNIFAEFAKILGTPVTGKHEKDLREVFSHIPELHGICNELGFVKKKKFLPLEIDFLVNKSRDYIFTEVKFSKKHEQTIQTDKFLKGERKKYFREGYPQEGWEVFRSARRKRLNTINFPTVYSNILKDYKKLNIVTMLTRDGYVYYCDLSPGKYHNLCYSFLAMFYIGTAARYRPSEVEEVLNGNFRSLVTEAAALCPNQFIYQLISLITKKVCVIPYAKI